MSSSDLSAILPRVAIVSRRCLRKNKFVDFVGEYHLDLIVRYGAVPIIVPRVSGVHLLLESFEPIHGVLLCEGEDIDPSYYSGPSDPAEGVLSPSDLEEICLAHSSDTSVDASKDWIELRLARACLERGVPFLGICRGSQVLNVACGGTLYMDVGKQLRHSVEHIDYENYDGHRHGVEVVRGTPLWDWFGGREEIMVNSYHHQGVRILAERFRVMALARDGLVEAFYDPEFYDADNGKFLMGLQFHPERMRNDSDVFDYPGCPRAYQEFVKAVVAYQKKLNREADPTAVIPPKLEPEMEEKRRVIVRSFSIAKGLYDAGRDPPFSKLSDLQVGADFLKSNAALSLQQERRLKQMGATVRNSSAYLQRLRRNQERESAAKVIMSRMSVPQLSELLSFYNKMGQICSQVLDRKLLPPTTSLEEAAAAMCSFCKIAANICTCNDIPLTF